MATVAETSPIRVAPETGAPSQKVYQSIRTAYHSLVEKASWLDRKLVQVTEELCHGDKELAAISRVATKTFATLALFLLLPFHPIVNFTLLALGQCLLSPGSLQKPWYATTALVADIFFLNFTLSNTLINAVTERGSPSSILFHFIALLGSGVQMLHRSDLHMTTEEERLPPRAREDVSSMLPAQEAIPIPVHSSHAE